MGRTCDGCTGNQLRSGETNIEARLILVSRVFGLGASRVASRTGREPEGGSHTEYRHSALGPQPAGHLSVPISDLPMVSASSRKRTLEAYENLVDNRNSRPLS